MKKVSGVFLFAWIGMLVIFAQPVQDHGQLKVEKNKLVDHNGETVKLNGMSFGWHNWWPRFYNAETVNWLKNDWKCTVIRAAMGVEHDSGYINKPVWSKQKVKVVVEAAINEGIYVIIDWHDHDIHLEEAKEFFIEMAREYGKYPNVIYEIFNEPDMESWKEVKEYSTEIISAIRKIDPDNIVLVGTPHWCQDIHIAADDPITGFENIMYTVHFYADTHKKWLRDRAEYALEKGIPVFVSESAGMNYTGNGPINYEEWENWIEWMNENQVSWVTWSVADKDETCSVLLPSAGSKGGWKEEDLKESGKLSRQYLHKFYEGK